MKLLTKDILAKLPTLYSTEKVPQEEKIAIVKFFHPFGGWTWYAVEYDPAEEMFYGIVIGFEKEWGYFSLAQLLECNKMGVGIERDKWFTPTRIKDIKELNDAR